MVGLLLGVSPLVSPLANKLVDAVQPLTEHQVFGLLLLGLAGSTATVAAVLFPTPGSRRTSLDNDAETQQEKDVTNAASS